MELTVIDSLDQVSGADFDRLDSSAGSAACYERTRQREHDGRWRCRYLRATEHGRLTALIPLYTASGRAWPDPVYDPSGWQLPPAVRDDYAAGNCLLVGGFADLRTGFAVADQAREPAVLRELLAAIARIAAEQDRCLVFPYHFPDARQALDEAAGALIGWALLGREGQLRGVSEPGWHAGMRAGVRYNLRH
ncbi:MAG TPA: hypothetical protein VGX49_11465, partial [Jatrophihabitans sp.]|nr:hypothetical protein [Jatrophihabitans sp.]